MNQHPLLVYDEKLANFLTVPHFPSCFPQKALQIWMQNIHQASLLVVGWSLMYNYLKLKLFFTTAAASCTRMIVAIRLSCTLCIFLDFKFMPVTLNMWQSMANYWFHAYSSGLAGNGSSKKNGCCNAALAEILCVGSISSRDAASSHPS